MKVVPIRKEKILNKRYQYFYDIGKQSIIIPRKFVTLDYKKYPWIKFPINNAILTKINNEWTIKYKLNSVVYDFFLYAGLKGDIKISIESTKEPTNYITYIITSDIKRKGIGKGVLLSIDDSLPIKMYWKRNGYFITGFLEEATILLFSNGDYKSIPLENNY